MLQLYPNKILIFLTILIFNSLQNSYAQNPIDFKKNFYHKDMFDKNIITQLMIDSVVIIHDNFEYNFAKGSQSKSTFIIKFNKDGTGLEYTHFFQDKPQEKKVITYSEKDLSVEKSKIDTTYYTHYYKDEKEDAELEDMAIRTETYKEFVKLTHYKKGLPVVIYYLINMPYETPFFMYSFTYYSKGDVVMKIN